MNWLVESALGAVNAGSWGAVPVIVILLAFNGFGLFKTTLPYLQAQQRGPIELTPAEILTMQTVDNTEQIYQIEGIRTFNTGFEYVISVNNFPAHFYYGVLQVEDRYLLFNGSTQIDETQLEYTGKFTTYVNKEVFDAVAAQSPGIDAFLLPVYFTEYATGQNSSMTFVIVFQVAIFAFTLYAIWRFVSKRVLRRN